MENNKFDVKKFTIIPIGITACRELSGTDKIIMGQIYSFYRDKKSFYANNRYISEIVGTTKSTVSKSISKLEKIGYLERKMKGFNSNGYPKRFLNLTKSGIDLALKDVVQKNTHRGEDSFADEYEDMVDE